MMGIQHHTVFLYELHQALERLHKYEEQDSNNFRNNIEKNT